MPAGRGPASGAQPEQESRPGCTAHSETAPVLLCMSTSSTSLSLPHCVSLSSAAFPLCLRFLSLSRSTAPDWKLFILTALFFWRLVCFHCLSFIYSPANLLFSDFFPPTFFSQVPLSSLFSTSHPPSASPPELYHSSLPGGLALDG